MAILAITAHWIANVFDLKEILLDVLEVNRAHSGLNIAIYTLKSVEDFAIKYKLFSVAGLKILGYDARDDLIEEDEERETDIFYFNWGKEQEYESDDNFDPSSIVDRVREICKFVRASPQRRKQFEECQRQQLQRMEKRPGEPLKASACSQPVRKSVRQGLSTATLPATTRKTNPPGKKGRPSGQWENSSLTDEGLGLKSVLQTSSTQPLQRVKALGLLLDVKTKWNSSCSMLQRFNDLQFTVTMFLNRVG
ncbi:hypothetical protein DAPPUDRAFT_320319 [Daphnia pulex]|uniref:Uncharacterized protein n=1 Tax=Daphnia pulex TaxID=6669 RepID=E9GPI8_DAPPU|nr:hypothetical protein DAPPUDRAFT_320319 [Daphnia pulex]|eukprot:EFX78644.1 hypothetical protein DAPPUDRAFT_320319 [Daphnia pulex]